MGGLTVAVAQKWLENIGANVLAGWLGTWGSKASEYVFGPEKVDEHGLLTVLSTDLHAQVAANETLRADVELLLDHTDAIIIALDALKDRQEEQRILLQLIREDQRRGDLIVGRLHRKVMAKLDQIENLIRVGVQPQSVDNNANAIPQLFIDDAGSIYLGEQRLNELLAPLAKRALFHLWNNRYRFVPIPELVSVVFDKDPAMDDMAILNGFLTMAELAKHSRPLG